MSPMMSDAERIRTLIEAKQVARDGLMAWKGLVAGDNALAAQDKRLAAEARRLRPLLLHIAVSAGTREESDAADDAEECLGEYLAARDEALGWGRSPG